MRMFQVCVCGQPLQLNEQPTPEPKGTEVLLKVLAAGVCHSDLHLADGWFDLGGGKRMSLADRGMKLPVTLGHENVGEVVAFGPDAKGVKVGDRRLAHPWIGCGSCGPCQRGEENLCRAMRSLGVFSVLHEIEWAKRHGIPHYYLGYWVHGAATMQYKANYRPHELLDRGEWRAP